MKKIYILFAILFIAGFSYAQNQIVQQKVKGVTPMQKTHFNASDTKTPTDTIFIDDFFNFGQATIYGNTGGGFVFGSNWSGTPAVVGSPECAQGYIITGLGYEVEQVLIWVGDIYKNSANGSSLTVTVNALDDSSHYGGGGTDYDIICPGTVLGTTTVPWADIDTTDFTVATFATPINVTTDYAVVVNVEDFYTNNDTIGFVSSADGGASGIMGVEYTWWKYPAAPAFWTEADHVYGVDNSIAFFPVVDASGVGIDGNYFISGMKLSQNQPNPANNSTLIQYEVENNSDVTLEIYDVTGRKVFVQQQGKQLAGKYTITINANELSNGVYYYSLIADGKRLTKKMIVNR